MAGKQGQLSTKATEVETRFDDRFMQELDGRCEVARDLRDRFRALVSDLGGLSTLSYQEQSLCRRLIHLERLVELKELKLAQGGRLDENLYFCGINALSGLLSKIGLKRRVKVLALADYLKHKETASEPTPTTATPQEPAP
jgi:hypothetical protein